MNVVPNVSSTKANLPLVRLKLLISEIVS